MAGRSAVGIVVDAGVVQAVELAAEGERLVLRRAVCHPLAADTFEDGDLGDASRLADSVRGVLRQWGLPRRNSALALGSKRTLARIIEIPASGDAEAEQILQDRIARYALYEDADVTWQAAPLATEAEDKHAYLASSGAAEEVAAVLPALRRVGVYVGHLEPYALATMRALVACVAEDDPPTVLVSLRNRSADFLIAHGRRPRLIRSVGVGAADMALDPQAIEDLMVEVGRSVAYCRTRFPDARPRLWLCVQANEGREVVELVESRLAESAGEADVEPLPAWPDRAPDATVTEGAEIPWAAVGVAMVGLARDEDVSRLDLAPSWWSEIQRVQRELMAFAASVAVAVLVTTVVTTTLRLTLGDASHRAQAASSRMEVNTVNVKTAAELKRQATEAVDRARLWTDVRRHVRPFDWVEGLETVTEAIPAGVRVREFSFRRGVLQVRGEAKSNDLIHRFVQALAGLAVLEEANIERLVRGGRPGAGLGETRLPAYTITCRFRETRPDPAPAPDAKGATP